MIEIIARFATKPNFVEYGEKKEGVQNDLIEPHREICRALYQLNSKLTFSQTDMKTVLTEVADPVKWPRPLTSIETVDFAERMAKRLRRMCRHLAQSKIKNVQWALSLLDEDVPDVKKRPDAAPLRRPRV